MSNDKYDEHCIYCRTDQEHTKKEHEFAMRQALEKEVRRDSALYRYAKRIYDNP